MNYCPILIPLLLMLKSYKEATETGSPCVSSFYESEGGRGELIQGRCLLKSGHLLKELCSVIFICDVCRNACRQIKIRSVPVKKKEKKDWDRKQYLHLSEANLGIWMDHLKCWPQQKLPSHKQFVSISYLNTGFHPQSLWCPWLPPILSESHGLPHTLLRRKKNTDVCEQYIKLIFLAS